MKSFAHFLSNARINDLVFGELNLHTGTTATRNNIKYKKENCTKNKIGIGHGHAINNYILS